MIEFQNIQKKFGKQQVLKSIDLKLEEPAIYAILGPNGSGKTTLIKSLMGMVKINEGKISFNGKTLAGDDYRKQISYLPQIARFPENLSANEFFSLIENLRGPAQRKQEAIKWFGVEEFLDKTLRNLSGGMRQKINLVSCLMYDSPIVVLDEPSIGLDPVAMIALKKWILEERAKGKHILLCSHLMDLVQELADEVIFLMNGVVHFKGNIQKLLEETGAHNLESAIAQFLISKKPSHAQSI